MVAEDKKLVSDAFCRAIKVAKVEEFLAKLNKNDPLTVITCDGSSECESIESGLIAYRKSAMPGYHWDLFILETHLILIEVAD